VLVAISKDMWAYNFAPTKSSKKLGVPANEESSIMAVKWQ